MTLGELENKLSRLNRNLHIHSATANPIAGVCVLINGEHEAMCGVQKFLIEEFPEYSSDGRMIAGGWHRVLYMLLSKGHIKLQDSWKYFGHWETHKEPVLKFIKVIPSPYTSVEIDHPLKSGQKVESPVYHNDDIRGFK